MNATSAAPAAKAARAKRRADPEARSVMGVEFGEIANAREDRKYLRANKVGRYNVDFYETIGYEVERRTEHGVSISGVKTELNQPITYADTVLMSIDLETWNRIQEYGLNGKSGQAYSKMLEDRILDRKRNDIIEDPSRNIYRSQPRVRGTTVTKTVTSSQEDVRIEDEGDDYGE
jgi:hypothetical protein